MIRKTIVTLWFCVLASGLCAQSIDDLIDLGNQNIKDRDFEAAVSNFTLALEQNSIHEVALNGVIRAYTLSKNYKEARKYVNLAVEQYPQNPEFVLRLGIVLNLEGSSEDAIEQFNRALAMNPDENIKLQLLMNEASAQLNLSNYAEAINNYDTAIELEPRNTTIYNCRGLANYRSGNFEEAVADYTNALDLDPSLTLPYYNRALAFLKMEQPQKACIDLQKACQLKIGDACKRIVLECRRN